MSQVRLTATQLNELELLLVGAYGPQEYVLPGEHTFRATLRIPDVAVGSHLDLLDTEATPIASVRVSASRTTSSGTWVAGLVKALRPLAAPAFAELRPSTSQDVATEHAYLLLGGATPPHTNEPIIVVDSGDEHTLSQAVTRARVHGSAVHVLPEPAAEHLEGAAKSDLLKHLAEVLFATTITIVDIQQRTSGEGLVILFTGLSGSGKSTIARALTRQLRLESQQRVTLLDGDEVRTLLSSGLGFSREDRELNVRRIGWIASLVSAHSGIAICAPIAPYESMRQEVRAMAERVGRFMLVHVATPLEECERRDRKGLYAKARAGEITGFTGVSDTYEEPTDADVTINTQAEDVPTSVMRVVHRLSDTAAAEYQI